MIRWKCRQCGEGMEAPESMASDLIQCGRCCGMERVPGGEAPATKRRSAAPAARHNAPIDRPVSFVLKLVLGLIWLGISALAACTAVTTPESIPEIVGAWGGVSIIMGILFLATCVRGVA